MKLSIMERIQLLQILPAEGDFLTLKIVRVLRESLSFSEKEHQEFEIKPDGAMIVWNPEKAREKDVEIGPKAHLLIADTLKELDKQKKLMLALIELYEKFVETE